MSLLDKEFSIAMEESEAKEVTPDLQKEEEKAADITQDRNDDPNSVELEGKEADDPETDDTKDDDDAKDEPEEASDDEKGAKKDAKCDCGDPECPECNPKAKKKVEEAVDFDLACDSIFECRGVPAIREAEEEMNYLCLEAVAMNIAFDKADTACTEAWTTSTSDAEKAAITESFKDSLKKYVERARNFFAKAKATVINVAKHAKNFIATMAQKIAAKVLGKAGTKLNRELGSSEATVKMPVELKKSLGDLSKKIANFTPKGLKDIEKIAAGDIADPEAARAKVAEFMSDVPDKKALIATILGEDKDVAVKDFRSTGSVASDLKGAANSADIDALRKEVEAQLNAAMGNFAHLKDIDSANMTIVIAAVNKLVALYNRKLSALTAIATAWMVARAKVLRAAWAGRKGLEKSPAAESATLLESFMDMSSIL